MEPRIASGTGIAVMGTKKLSQEIETAMANAVLSCAQHGITDPNEIRTAMMAERHRIKEEWGAVETLASLQITDELKRLR